jgi:ABC-type transport system substrate-binding protein
MGGMAAVALFAAAPGCSRKAEASSSPQLRVLQLPIRTDGPKSLDPVRGSTVYDNVACAQVYETLLQYKYLKRPLELEPLLLESMPTTSDNPDGTQTWHFRLKPGVRFADDPCFPGSKGREVRSSDVFYSWKRLADAHNDPKSWWLFEDTVVGFDEYRAAQNKAENFDYDAPVPGFREVSGSEFEVVLKRPLQQFQWKLAMFQTSIVAREGAEKYGSVFGGHPVGTGPFVLDRWRPGVDLTLNRNPNYHQCVYPSELPADPSLAQADREAGFDKDAGRKLPLADRIEYTMFVQDQPMYLQFRVGNLGYIETPSEYQVELFNKRTKMLKPEYRREGMLGHAVPLLDFIFDGFNMEDPVVGGYTPEHRALRQAVSLAMDYKEINEAFYENICTVYDGPIPPGLDGFPKDGDAPVSYRGPRLEKARELLAKAGYGPGKPLVLDYYTSQGGNNQEQSEMRRRQLAQIGVDLRVNLVDFSTLIERISTKGAPFFGFAWGSDYPDAENNLAMFFGPNEAPGSNSYNYKSPAYDALYRKIQTMPPGPERTKIYEQMRDMVIEDCPFVGSLGRTRMYAVNPWLKNFKPTEDFWNWPKYLDVDDSKR